MNYLVEFNGIFLKKSQQNSPKRVISVWSIAVTVETRWKECLQKPNYNPKYLTILIRHGTKKPPSMNDNNLWCHKFGHLTRTYFTDQKFIFERKIEIWHHKNEILLIIINLFWFFFYLSIYLSTYLIYLSIYIYI